MDLPECLKGAVGDVDIKGPGVFLQFDIGGFKINITETVIIGTGVMLGLCALVIFLTSGMKKNPERKRQVIAEWAVEVVDNLVEATMGKGYDKFAPYIAALFASSIFGSLIGLTGLRPVTADYSTPLTWALMTFIMIERAKIKANGIGGYLKSFINPLNIISELSTPVSMSFRHYGNIAGGIIITTLIYVALTGLSSALGLPIPIFAIGIPAGLSLYFDLFTGFMQAFIFINLTMIYIGSAKSED